MLIPPDIFSAPYTRGVVLVLVVVVVLGVSAATQRLSNRATRSHQYQPNTRTGTNMEWLFLLVSLAGAGLTYNAYRPTYAPARGAFISFVVGCPTIELALHAIVLQSVVALGFIWAGTLQTWPGLVALGIALVSSAVLGYGYWRGLGTEAIVEHALQKHLGTHYRQGILRESAATFEPGWKWHQIVSPFPIRPQEV